MLFPGRAPLDRPAAARAAGFMTVETWWPPAPAPGAWADAVRAAGLKAALVNADGGDLAAGERGFCNLPERADEVLGAVDDALAVAGATGAGVVNLLVGRAVADRPLGPQLAQARAVVRECGRRAAAAGRTIVIEPINARDVPDILLPTPAAAAAFVREVADDSVRLLYDAYHAARAGLDPVADLARHMELIAHVQYADHPGRGAPGTGTVDLWRLVDRLEALGYAGAVGLEYDPRGAPVAPPARPGG